jgi:uncharacterized repeat protein (TIGR03803 family)
MKNILTYIVAGAFSSALLSGCGIRFFRIRALSASTDSVSTMKGYSLLRILDSHPNAGGSTGNVTKVGNTLYGLANLGGSYGDGAVFSIPVAGGVPTTLYSFKRTATDGAFPQGSFTLSADAKTLYGVTVQGGPSDMGTVFSFPVAGGSPTMLYGFSGGADAAYPNGDLIHIGGTLYGMTDSGGTFGFGTVYSLPDTGGPLTILHHFSQVGTDGGNAPGALVAVGSTLFGMTYSGGSTSSGTIFSIGTDGSGFNSLYSFTGVGADGANPAGNLILSSDGSTLYGMTSAGGTDGVGTIFSYPVAGGTPTILYSFTGGVGDGSYPNGSLTFSADESLLYGLTSSGGPSGGGFAFSLPVAGGSPSTLYAFTGVGSDGSSPTNSLLLSGTSLYGTTSGLGTYNHGTVFSVPTAGGSSTTLAAFNGNGAEGSGPDGDLIASGNMLYGTTRSGGLNNLGTVFSIPIGGGPTTTLYSFTGGASDGDSPSASLTVSADGTALYGTTAGGGPVGVGTIFSVPVSGGPSTILHGFTGAGSDGGKPYGTLTLSPDGMMLYGTANIGGASGDGIIFSLPTTGASFTTLYEFTGVGSDGNTPNGALLISNGLLYGTTQSGGTSAVGNIFSIPISGGVPTTLYSFTGIGADGESPGPNLLLSPDGTTFYGLTGGGGAAGLGVEWRRRFTVSPASVTTARVLTEV